MKKPFNLQEWLKDKSQKVVTRDGRPVRIVCTDSKADQPIVALITHTYEGGGTYESVETYKENGHYWSVGNKDADLDLFLVTEDELSETEDERIRKELVAFFKEVRGDYLHGILVADILAYLEKQKEEEGYEAIPVESTLEYKLGFKAGKDSVNCLTCDQHLKGYLAGRKATEEEKQESESCEPDTNVEKVIEDVIRVYGKIQGEWVGGYDADTLIVNLRRAFNKKEQKPEWSEEDENTIESIKGLITMGRFADTNTIKTIWKLLDSLRPSWKPSEEQMYCLEEIIAFKNPEPEVIKGCESLYNELKKLKED